MSMLLRGLTALLLSFIVLAPAQAQTREESAVGDSINYVFATDLGSGVYDLAGRTLQIYRFTYDRELRERPENGVGVKFVLPVTVGFFDFQTVDVISEGIPTRVDSFSVVPGIEFDYLLRDDWHLVPYARAGFSVASSSVDGWLYGAGFRVQKDADFHGWDSHVRTEVAYAAVNYRSATPNDQFVRLRQGFDLTRPWGQGRRAFETGLYAIVDMVLDPPTAPVAGTKEVPVQAELGFTFATRPRFKIWRWDAPRLGLGYRFAGDLSAWRIVLGQPF